MQVYCKQCSSIVWLARKRDSVHCNQVVPKKSSHHSFSLIHLSVPPPPSMAKHAHYWGIISIKSNYSLTQILEPGPSTVNILLTTNFTVPFFLFYLSVSPPSRMAKYTHYWGILSMKLSDSLIHIPKLGPYRYKSYCLNLTQHIWSESLNLLIS